MGYHNPVEDELAIRDLCARYIDAINRIDDELWKSTWAEDASWSLLGQDLSGRDNLVTFWRNTMGVFNFVIMTLNSGTVDIQGDRATGRWYVKEQMSIKGTEPGIMLGIYDDEYVKQDGCWLFQSRKYHILYQGPADMSGEHHPYPAG